MGGGKLVEEVPRLGGYREREARPGPLLVVPLPDGPRGVGALALAHGHLVRPTSILRNRRDGPSTSGGMRSKTCEIRRSDLPDGRQRVVYVTLDLTRVDAWEERQGGAEPERSLELVVPADPPE